MSGLFLSPVLGVVREAGTEAVYVLGALLALGAGVITYLVREVGALKRAQELDERTIRTLQAIAVDLAASNPDPQIRERVRRKIDRLNDEREEES